MGDEGRASLAISRYPDSWVMTTRVAISYDPDSWVMTRVAKNRDPDSWVMRASVAMSRDPDSRVMTRVAMSRDPDSWKIRRSNNRKTDKSYSKDLIKMQLNKVILYKEVMTNNTAMQTLIKITS